MAGNKEDKKTKILGLLIDQLSMEEVMEKIEEYISCGRSHKIFYANPHVMLMAQKYPELASYFNNADIVLPDGYGVVLAGKLLNLPIKRRIIGLDVLLRLSDLAAEKGWRLYFLGAQKHVLQKSLKILEERFDGINIVGSHHGYFSEAEESTVVEDIASKNPDIVVVCMGVGKQESFIHKYSQRLAVSVFFGNGGALDFVSGRLKRAPRWMQKHGLEWVFRFLQEPRRLWKRYTLGNLIFMTLVLKQRLRDRSE